jgi:lysozyme
MSLNQNGINLIKSFEQLRLKAYDDKQPNKDISDPAIGLLGIITVGYGSTGPWIQRNTVITEEQAEHFLVADLAKAQSIVDKRITVPLNDNQYSALVSFAFNCGGYYHDAQGQLHHYQLWDFINQKKSNDEIVAKWITTAITSGGQQMAGLIRRRTAEAALFVKPLTEPSGT